MKWRDWYVFEWYVRNGVKLNFSHLQERIKQFDGIEMSKDESEIWSNDYFLQLADMIKLE